MKNRKSLEELTLLDRFLFDEVMDQPENLQILLEIILSKAVILKGETQTEKEIRKDVDNRMIRLDVWTIDQDDTVYDTEVQKVNTHNLQKRSRLYQGLIDSRLLPPGSIDFNELNPVFVILITPFDLFGQGRYLYTFEERCVQDLNLSLGDGATRLFLNTHGKNEDEVPRVLIELLHFLEYTDTENTNFSDKRLERLKENVGTIRNDAKVGARYMQAWEEKVMDRQEGYKEGKEKGREEGREEGLYAMMKLTVENSLRKGRTAEEIAEYNDYPVEEVKQIAENFYK